MPAVKSNVPAVREAVSGRKGAFAPLNCATALVEMGMAQPSLVDRPNSFEPAARLLLGHSYTGMPCSSWSCEPVRPVSVNLLCSCLPAEADLNALRDIER